MCLFGQCFRDGIRCAQKTVEIESMLLYTSLAFCHCQSVRCSPLGREVPRVSHSKSQATGHQGAPFCSAFDVGDTQAAKGLAICLMLIHHLFGFPSRIAAVGYVPMMMAGTVPIEYEVAHFGRVCVSMFLFLSGYGMSRSLVRRLSGRWRYVSGKLIAFLIHYWVCFLICVPIGMLFFKDGHYYAWKPSLVVSGLLGLNFSYNPEWWFVGLYIKVLLLSPLVVSLTSKHTAVTLAGALALRLLPWVFTTRYLAFWRTYELARYLLPFVIGCVVADRDAFRTYSRVFQRIGPGMSVPVHVAGVILSVIWVRVMPVYEIVIPFMVFHFTGMVVLARLSSAFAVLGRYSLCIWLCHSFFCYYYFQRFIFAARYSVLIFILLVLMSLTSAMLLERTSAGVIACLRHSIRYCRSLSWLDAGRQV